MEIFTAEQARVAAKARSKELAEEAAKAEAEMRRKRARGVLDLCMKQIKEQIACFPETPAVAVYADYEPEVVTTLQQAGYKVTAQFSDGEPDYFIEWGE